MTKRKKIIIAVASFGVFCLISLLAAAIYSIRSLTDTNTVKSQAANFMTISSPLPEGFHYLCGYNVAGIPLVQITDDQANMLYTFTSTPSLPVYHNRNEAKRAVDEVAQSKPLSAVGYGMANKMKVKVHDRLSVGGETMYYVLGHTDNPMNPDNDTVNAFYGAVQSSKNDKLIFLLIQRSNAILKDYRQLKIERVKTLTDCIKAF